jgi:pectate lyase
MCGDECISVRSPSANHITNVTISNNKFTDSFKGIVIGNHDDIRTDSSIGIAATVYRNRFVNIHMRAPRVESAAVHVINNVFEHWYSKAVLAFGSTPTDEDGDPDPPDHYLTTTKVNTRVLVEHNVFRELSMVTTGEYEPHVAPPAPGYAPHDVRLWHRENVTNGSSLSDSSFPTCNWAWYYPCNVAGYTNLDAMTYGSAITLLRSFTGFDPDAVNDVRD